MAPVWKIAVVQMYPEPLALDLNHATAISHIRHAASQNCHLAVLPEYHLTSWEPSAPSFVSLCAQYEQYLAAYQALAKELGICIVPGTIVEKRGEELRNVACFIDGEGCVRGRYEKKNLWHPERPHLTGGGHEPHVAFDTPLGKVGLLICWDLAFPEAFRSLIAEGAKIIIIPTFWTLQDCSAAGLARNPLAEELFLDSMLTARAFENTCAVVFANAGGPKGGERGAWAGGTQVAVPFIGALGRQGWEEGVGIVELDMEILEEAEANYKVREDIGRDGWHYDYTLTRDQAGEGQ